MPLVVALRLDPRGRLRCEYGHGLTPVDVKGAQHLRRAIEQHEHWRRSDAVRAGHQSQRDPHVSQLVDFADSVRRYLSPDGNHFEKRLLDGLWV